MPPGEEIPARPSQLDDYRLEEQLSEGQRTRTWRARQISMNRPVVIEILKEEWRGDEGAVRKFLEDVRAKAAIEDPGIGTVYEAAQGAGGVFYVREWLPGESLEKIHDEAQTFEPLRVVTLLRQVGGAMEYLQERGIAHLPLEPRHLVLGPHDVLRLVNLAVAGEPDPGLAERDRHLVAELLLDMVKPGRPGATRTAAVLQMMVEPEGDPLSWAEIAQLARTLERYLAEGAIVASQPLKETSSERPADGESKTTVAVLIGILLIATLGAGGFFLASGKRKRPKVRDLSEMVEVPGGSYQNQDGKTVELARFWIDAHEVTIAEYARFLEVLAELPEDRRRAYDHPEQSPIKPDHTPDDWESLLTAARSGGTWQGVSVSPNHPVMNVDWWDAYAYAAWQAGRLPTQEEWFAAAQQGVLAPSEWGEVDTNPADVTPQGVHGMAGNVAEWVRDSARNPAYPMNPKKPLACGASHLQPRNGARTRAWLDSREVRRPDLGFRIVRDIAP